jgi:hypothetical protein
MLVLYLPAFTPHPNAHNAQTTRLALLAADPLSSPG